MVEETTRRVCPPPGITHRQVERTLRVGGRAPPPPPPPPSSSSPTTPAPAPGNAAAGGAAVTVDGHPVRHTLVLLVSAPSGAAALALPAALTRSGAVLTRVVHGPAPPGAVAAATAGEEAGPATKPAAEEPPGGAPWGGCGTDGTPAPPPVPGVDPEDGFDRWAYDTSI